MDNSVFRLKSVMMLLSGQIALDLGREDRVVVSYARKTTLWAAKPLWRSVTILDRFSGPSSFQPQHTTEII